jgi:hypothetical protein
MKNRIYIFALSVLFYPASYAQTTTEPSPCDGQKAIIQFFHEKPLVAIGEVHGHAQLYDFLNALVQQKEFYSQVNDIVIESGNALYQPILDRYISGENVEMKELQQVWMNTTQSPVDPWRHTGYFNLLKTVRDLNQKISSENRIRVVAADPPIDWKAVNSLEDYEKARGNRDAYYAQTVIEQVLQKQRKALLINGGAHFGNHKVKNAFANQRIEEAYPNSLTLIQAPAGLGPANAALEQKLANWPQGSISNIKDTWIGELPGFSRMAPVSPTTSQPSTPQPAAIPSNLPAPPKFNKQDMYEYLLYFGSSKEISYTSVETISITSEEVWKEMNRRSMIRFNNPLLVESRAEGLLRPTAYN